MFERRAIGVFWFFCVFSAVLIFRLCGLTLIEGRDFYAAAQKQQSYSFEIASRRAIIYDCAMRPLTYSQTSYIAVVEPAVYGNENELLKRLLPHVKIDEKRLSELISQGRPFSVEIASLIDPCPGLMVVPALRRSPGMLTHIIGAVDADNKGVSGIEKSFDAFLKANGGKMFGQSELSALRRQLEGCSVSVFSDDYYTGGGVILTIDKRIQKIAEEAAELYLPGGAIVVCEIATGEIRAIVSRPDYDAENLAAYLSSTNGELVNRALRPYNIGSVFKIIVTAAALEKGADILARETTCTGACEVGSRSFACHKQQGHGPVDLESAFINSCNVFFIELALDLGLDSIIDTAKGFGIGASRVLTADIIALAGKLPRAVSPAPPALLANTAIGQGDIMLTPLDVISVVNTIASGGVSAPLSLVTGLVDKSGNYAKYKVTAEKYRPISKDTADIIKELMIKTCEEGTGASALPERGGAGGKTASAETGWLTSDGEKIIHGWFAGFFPADNPKYSVAVIVENGRTGSASACPAFKHIADAINALEAS